MYKILQLNLDDAFDLQDLFKKELQKLNAEFIYFDQYTKNLINECRLFANKKKVLNLINILVEKLKIYNINSPLMTFYGSGDFHHLTLALIKLAAIRTQKKFTIIHIDNHPDWVKDPVISCGSWVNTALEQPYINKVISIGISSSDLNLPELKRANLKSIQNEKLIVLPFNSKHSFVFRKYKDCASFYYKKHKIIWNNIGNLNSFELFSTINNYINREDIYITIDKDVINTNEQITNWDQGNFTLHMIVELLQYLVSKTNIVGIDILGDYSAIVYKGSLVSRIYKKFEVLKDQPKINKTRSEISKINELSNLMLLKSTFNLTI